MKKIIILSAIILLLCKISLAQSISPNENNEFCPNTEFIFSGTVPGINPTIEPFNNSPIIVQSPYNIVQSGTNSTTFNFKLKFNDVNIAQSIKIKYITSSGANYKTIIFKKIKSLFYSDPAINYPSCNVIVPVQSQPIIFPRCQITSTTINFPNVKWYTAFENPEVCFGTVTEYEYLLPSGWKLGNVVSDGNTWIAGNNNVTITSDLGTGDGMDIKIKASNKLCGNGLANNGPISTVKISRPAPNLSITGSSIICFGGNQSYSINGLPNGATVSWSLSNPNLASIVGSSNSSSVIVSNNSNNNSLNLIATVTHCSYTYTRTYPIQLGNPVMPVINRVDAAPYPGGPIDVRSSVTNGSTIVSHKWFIDGNLVSTQIGPPEPVVTLSGGGGCGSHSISLQVINNCGSSNSYSSLYNRVCSGGFSLLISPNPSSDYINIEIIDEEVSNRMEKSYIDKIELVNKSGLVIYNKKFAGNVSKVNIPTSRFKNDNYTLRVYNGRSWTSKQIIIAH